MIKSFSILPSALLRPYVHHYWVMKSDGDDVSETIFPPACMKWVFHRGVPFAIDGDSDDSRQASLCVQYDRPVQVTSHRRLEMISVFFTPYATRAVMQMPAELLAGKLLDFDDVDDKELSALKRRVHDADSTDEAIMLIDTFLQRRVLGIPQSPYIDQLAHVFDVMSANPQAKIPMLAEKACLCERQFRTIFSDNVGFSPKHMIRINRFKTILNRLVTNPEVALEELVLETDLTDYSHLNKEFRHFAGMTPRQYLELLQAVKQNRLLGVYKSYYCTL
ncbi:MAG: helix-turn-helix domain-containing protein [Bacteroidales bacterium]|nr:helix-turn-helix domain-containing protein [Bacteroidales bacterium]